MICFAFVLLWELVGKEEVMLGSLPLFCRGGA